MSKKKKKMKLKKKNIIICILAFISLIVSALIGIFAIITGSFGTLEAKILSTTLTIFMFSISGLCCSTIYEDEKYKKISLIGIIISLVSAIYTLLIIWGVLDICIIFCKNQNRYTWRILWSLIVLSCSSAHLSLILKIDNKNDIVQKTKLGTIIMSLLLDCMILILTWDIIQSNDIYSRIIIVIAILVTLGTIVTPILNKINKKD